MVLVSFVTTSGACVCVTGASGFIGRAVVEHLLQAGCEVRASVHHQALQRAGVAEYAVDLEKMTLDAAFLTGAQVLVHVAGLAHTYNIGSGLHQTVTVNGGRWLFDEAVKAGVHRIVLVSSCKAGFEYGTDVDEAVADRPQSVYGNYKLAQERMLREVSARHGIDFVILRPALVYGVGASGNLATWFKRSRHRVMPAMPIGGRRSMVSVADLASAIFLACHSAAAPGNTYYVSDGESYFIQDIDAAIRRFRGHHQPKPAPVWLWHAIAFFGSLGMLVGIDLGIDRLRLANILKDSTCSSLRLQTQLGWHPRQRFYDLIPKMLLANDKMHDS